MKRFLISLVIFLLIPVSVNGEEINPEEYNKMLSGYDLSFFENTLDKDTYAALEELGLSGFSYENIYSLSIDDVKNVILTVLNGNIKSPLEGCAAVAVFIILSAFFKSLKPEEESLGDVYSTVSSLLIALILIVKLSPTVTLASSSIGISADFIYAFIPVFCAVTVASGGVTVGFSTNSLLLILSQGLSFISSAFFMPAVNCMLALGICTSLRPQLGIAGVTESLKKLMTSVMSFLAGIYVSVLSIKTAAASKADALGIRSVRFVISSVVPVVGGALSEGMVSIQAYSSLIKSSVGIVGIVAVALVFLPSLAQIICWRFSLTVCSMISEAFCDNAVTSVIKAFSSALLVMNVLLIICALTTVVSIGVLIAAGS